MMDELNGIRNKVFYLIFFDKNLKGKEEKEMSWGWHLVCPRREFC
jgi:hypothetical protein